jgi:AraC family transcriptional regulator
MLPEGTDFGVRLGGGLSILHLYVRQAVVEEVAADVSSTDRENIELIPRFGDKDPLIGRLALEVRHTLQIRTQVHRFVSTI